MRSATLTGVGGFFRFTEPGAHPDAHAYTTPHQPGNRPCPPINTTIHHHHHPASGPLDVGYQIAGLTGGEARVRMSAVKKGERSAYIKQCITDPVFFHSLFCVVAFLQTCLGIFLVDFTVDKGLFVNRSHCFLSVLSVWTQRFIHLNSTMAALVSAVFLDGAVLSTLLFQAVFSRLLNQAGCCCDWMLLIRGKIKKKKKLPRGRGKGQRRTKKVWCIAIPEAQFLITKFASCQWFCVSFFPCSFSLK